MATAVRGGGGFDTTTSAFVCKKYHNSHIQPKTNAYGYGYTQRVSTPLSLNHHHHQNPILWIPSWKNCSIRRPVPLRVIEQQTQVEEVGVSYEVLKQRLASGQWQLADEETRRLLIVLAGAASMKRKYVFFSEVKFIPASDLKTIDELWRSHSNNRFGYSVQKRIWNKVNRDFTEFFKQVGWMKRLDTEIEQYTYRSFPSEFIWELNDSTPEGHLPLTNALRGAQLLANILQHPAFDTTSPSDDDDGKDKEDIHNLLDSKPSSVRSKSFTPNYKF